SGRAARSFSVRSASTARSTFVTGPAAPLLRISSGFVSKSRARTPASRAAASSRGRSDAADCKIVHDEAGDFERAAHVEIAVAAQARIDVDEIARHRHFADRIGDLTVFE